MAHRFFATTVKTTTREKKLWNRFTFTFIVSWHNLSQFPFRVLSLSLSLTFFLLAIFLDHLDRSFSVIQILFLLIIIIIIVIISGFRWSFGLPNSLILIHTSTDATNIGSMTWINDEKLASFTQRESEWQMINIDIFFLSLSLSFSLCFSM